jgi:hypothetical protein
VFLVTLDVRKGREEENWLDQSSGHLNYEEELIQEQGIRR